MTKHGDITYGCCCEFLGAHEANLDAVATELVRRYGRPPGERSGGEGGGEGRSCEGDSGGGKAAAAGVPLLPSPKRGPGRKSLPDILSLSWWTSPFLQLNQIG